jgi:outer membrane biosynthesis protein TonB
LQNKSNNDIRKSAAVKKNGLLGTILIHSILFSLLILVGFSSPPPPDTEEGILVNFGTDETGTGLIEPSPPAGLKEATTPAAHEATSPPVIPKTTVKTKDEALLTQNTEEAPSVKKVEPALKKPDSEAEKRKLEKREADKKIKEQLEADKLRIREEENEKKKIAAEQQRESDIMNKTKNALANSKNTGTSSTSEGVAGGAGNQGDPRGSIDSKVRGVGGGLGDSGNGNGGGKGISYDLKGRGFQSLPSPKYDVQEGGRVVVEVSVDPDGKVVQANPGAKGTTTLDENLLKVAKVAALAARFEVKKDAPPIQKGTITYNFILK